MHWERALMELFDDLEGQAAGLAQQAREDDAADLARAEYAEVRLSERLHAAVGGRVTLDTVGGAVVRGRLERVGQACAAVSSSEVPRTLHLVNLVHVVTASTASAGAAASASLPVTSRLGFASAVRHLSDDVDDVALRLCDGRRLAGGLGRVGADFVELVPDAPEGVLLVPLAAVVTIAPA